MKGHYERTKTTISFGWKKLILAIVVILGISAAVACADDIAAGILARKTNHEDVPEIIYTQPTEVPIWEEDPNVPRETIDGTVSSKEKLEPAEKEEMEQHVNISADYINFLIVGQAAREGEAARFADTMILCTVNTYKKTLTMTSLLRDSFVKMPDYKEHFGGRIKLTTIYHLGSVYGAGKAGSMELMNQTLYDNFGIEVDHNIEVDFDAFIKVIDMLGGVDIELTEAEAEYLNNDDFWVYYDVEPGMAHLDGMTALCYARMRKAAGDGDSDIHRTSRQRKLVEELMNQIRDQSVFDLMKIADEILPLITTSMDSEEIKEFMHILFPMIPELTIEKGGTCPAHYEGDMVDIYEDGMKHSVLRFDTVETKKLMRELTEGELR